ncbi:MAG: DNA-directed RNA polymerase subunit H [Nanoarchaeota archaeon]|nr:DNA-directed RNA polymerase subunit H [Nanoarchaeota archaeon]
MESNVLTHVLSPKYRVMTDQEVESLLSKYKISKKDLPKIKSTDPAVVAIGAQEGQVLEITRKSRTAGESYYYRLIVK